MKVSFKPLSLAVAVSAAAAGYAGSINASSQERLADNSALGDAAIVPYYTVRGDWTTGVSIINTSAQHSSRQGSITSRHRFNGRA